MADESSAVRVAVRVRPLLPHDLAEGREDALQTFANGIAIPLSGKEFTYDQVVPGNGNDSQHKLYTESIQPLVDCTLSGHNVTVLAYGQTGSGKTHTMMGGVDASTALSSSTQDERRQWGVIPRIASDVFDRVKALQSDASDGVVASVKASFLEIYVSDSDQL
jgi:chromosomal replication initiation ATPase DnaA